MSVTFPALLAAHDFKAQRDETFVSFHDLKAENELPDMADLSLYFVPSEPDLDHGPLLRALEQLEFECEWFEPEDADDEPCLVATLTEQPASASAIWVAEELASRMALGYGFLPDGWGLEG